MISPTRRSAIPVSTSGVRRLMNRSLSRSTLIDGAAPATTATRQPSPSGALATADDLHTFTLLEENIALKESCEQLGKFHADQQQRNQRLHAELVEVRSQCDRLQQSEATVRAQLHRTDAERLLVQTTCAEHEATVAGYQQQLRALELKHENAVQQAAVCQREHATDGIVGALRVQLAATELQLYEANEKIAELTEENGRSQAECASVTALARMVCGAVPSSRISMGANAVREIKSQYDIFASVARATPDSRSLLAALQLMVTASSNGTTAMGDDGDAVAWNGGVQQQQQQQQQPPPKTPQPQQPQQQQPPPVKQSPAVGGNAAVGGDDNGRIVQMQMPPPPHNNNKHQQRPPPPPVPPRHFNTAHATGSLGTVHTHIIATNSSRPNGPDSNGINAVHLLPSPHHPPYVHRPYPPQTMPTMATGMDNMTAAPRQQVVMEDTIFV